MGVVGFRVAAVAITHRDEGGIVGDPGVQGGVHQEKAHLNPLAQALTPPPYSRTQPPWTRQVSGKSLAASLVQAFGNLYHFPGANKHSDWLGGWVRCARPVV